MAKFEFNEAGCTFIPDMTIASEGRLRDFADDFEIFMGRITGRSGSLHDEFNGSSFEFSDLIAWKIKDEADYDQTKWQQAVLSISFLISTTQKWADDVEDYKYAREANVERWKHSEKLHLKKIKNAETRDAIAWTGARADAVSAMRLDFEAQRHKAETHWDEFQEKAQVISDMLKKGATEENVRKLQDSGYLSWAPFNIMGPKYDKPEFPPLKGGVPKEGSDPNQVNAWWESLSPSQREALMAKHPDTLRMMDGIPAEVRDELNRDHLDEVLPRVKEQYGDDSAEYRELKKLKNETLDAEGTERYLLALDTTDGKGRAILADGNPDTADNVATLVPGTGIKWQAINGQLGRAEVIKKEAQEVDPDATHAVISWIGYNTPDDAEAISEDYAVAASQGLRDFQIGLRSTHEGKPSNNTIIGHSYGSTLAGHAMQGTGLDADNYVFVGSPGLNAEHVSDLGVPGSKVHVSTAKNDTINAFTPDFVHGADPTSEDFGASVFDSADGSMLGKFPFGQAHSDYFKRNSKSARHMGEIVAGQH